MTGKRYQAAGLTPLTLMTLSTDNPIHNGGFDVWQRATSFVSPAHGTYTADRWVYGTGTTSATHTVSQSTDVPAVALTTPLSNYSILIDCTTADAAMGTIDIVTLGHYIEGYTWKPFAQQALTLGFWVKATKTGTYCVSLHNSLFNRSYVAEYTVNVSDTWEYKTIAVAASPSAGTWDYTNGIGLAVNFALMCGATYQTTAGSWQVGTFYATSSQVNACDSTANNVRIWGVAMGLGSTVAPFWPRSFGEELEICQRYYQTSYPYTIDVPSVASAAYHTVNTNSILNNQAFVTVRFGVPMRSPPNVTIYPYTTVANTGRISNEAGTDQAASSGTVGASDHKAFTVSNTSGGTITLTQSAVFFGWQASADL